MEGSWSLGRVCGLACEKSGCANKVNSVDVMAPAIRRSQGVKYKLFGGRSIFECRFMNMA